MCFSNLYCIFTAAILACVLPSPQQNSLTGMRSPNSSYLTPPVSVLLPNVSVHSSHISFLPPQPSPLVQ
ncbi:hypothetical protein XELAEV_18025179mg [Xenopus laevis]|uniref:Secreted protein n=1 Tax=Xenopus laevis TaxID=8355 RepID=A0A974D1V8_XENLA|nr:hypothetical protein XELAEV_18025179mg [Xenopus laevis]